VAHSTQFPEIPVDPTPEELEKNWMLDETMRDKKQIYSLEQIWNFLS
jgi:hypothetical protein